MEVLLIGIISAATLIIVLASVTVWIFQYDTAARLAVDNAEKIKNAARTPVYELTTEDKDVLINYPDSTIAGCYNDVKEGQNKQKCKAFISYLRDRCDQYSNAFRYCKDPIRSMHMLLIESG